MLVQRQVGAAVAAERRLGRACLLVPGQQLRRGRGDQHQVVALGGHQALQQRAVVGDAVHAEDPLRAAPLPAHRDHVGHLPRDQRLGQADQGADADRDVGPVGLRQVLALGGVQQERHRVGLGQRREHRELVRTVAQDRGLAAPRRVGHPLRGVPQRDVDRRPSRAGRGARDAQPARQDPAHRLQELPPLVADRRLERAVGPEGPHGAVQQRALGDGYVVEPGQTVVQALDRLLRARHRPDPLAQVAVPGEPDQEREDAVVGAAGPHPRHHDRDLRDLSETAVRHVLLRRASRRVQHEPAGVRVVDRLGLQRRHVVAVAELGGHVGPERGQGVQLLDQVGDVGAVRAVVHDRAEAQVVVHHQDREHRDVGQRRPLGQGEQPLGVGQDRAGPLQPAVHDPGPLVGQQPGLVRGQPGPGVEDRVGQQVADVPVGAFVGAVEQQPGQVGPGVRVRTGGGADRCGCRGCRGCHGLGVHRCQFHDPLQFRPTPGPARRSGRRSRTSR